MSEQSLELNAKVSDLVDASKAVHIENVGVVPFLITHKDYEATNLKNLLPMPPSIDQKLNAHCESSFIDLINRFKTDDSVVFLNARVMEAKAIIDFANHEKPAWGNNKIVWQIEKSDEWKSWMKAAEQRMSQYEFALFLQDHAEDVHVPSGDQYTNYPSSLEMISVSQNFKLKRNVEFSNDIDLANGNVQLTFKEKDSSVGNIECPTEFAIAIPWLKRGEKHYVLKARLKHRMDDGKAWFSFAFSNIDPVLESAENELSERLAKDSGLPVIFGES